MRVTVQTLSAARKRRAILRLALAAGTIGVTMQELRVATGCSLTTIGVALRVLRDQGEVEASQPRGGPGNRWGAPGTLAAYQALHADRLAARAARQVRRRNNAVRKAADEDFANGFDRLSIVRIVPAHLAAPLRPAGPCSVFALGVAA